MKKILLLNLLFIVFVLISEIVVAQDITISGNTTVCTNSSSPLVTLINTRNLPVTVTYNINGSTNQTISINANATTTISQPTGNAGSFTYRLVSAQSPSSPGTNITVSMATVTINIVVAPFILISGTTTICEGSNANITFSNARNVSTFVTYNINGGANQQITIEGNSNTTVGVQSIVSGSPYVYNLVSAQYSSFIPSCPTNISGSATVTVKGTPIVTISGSDNICEGLSKTVTFTNFRNTAVDLVYKINNGVDQTITVPGNNSASVNQQGILAGSPFVYSLQRAQYSTSPNCQTALSGSASISVKSAPQKPVIDWNGIQLSTNLTGVSYQWYLNNNMINGANASTYTPTVNGNYNLVVTSNGCSTSSQDFILTATSVSSVNPGSDTYARIYPNPAQNYVVISLNKLPNTVLDILILNSVGMVVKTFKSNSRQTQLNIEDLPSGSYLIKIISANIRQFNKVEIFK